MKIQFICWLYLLAVSWACGPAVSDELAHAEPSGTPAAQTREAPLKESTETQNGTTPKVFITLENKETGELKEVEAGVTLKSGEKFFLPAFNPAATASFDGVSLVDDNLHPVNVDLDKVFLIEYWSEEGLTQNQFWSQMRQLELTHKNSDEIGFLSINYDVSFDGKEQVAMGREALKKFSAPERVLFDIKDSFRDNFPVVGPTNYILIDSRQQIVAFGRGDNPNTQEVFDKVRDSLLYLRSQRTGGIQIVDSSEQ